MKSYVSNAGQRLINELRLLCDYPFARRCGAILEAVFPAMVETPARSEWDRAGIDLCLLAEDPSQGLLYAFQCKGFGVKEFESSQLAQCLHSIKTFFDSPVRTKRFGLVVNQIVKGENRKKVEAALELIVHAGKAESAKLLDLEAFLEMVFLEGQNQLLDLLRSSVDDFEKQHQERMGEDIYVEEVPFRIKSDDQYVLERNPLRFVKERVLKLIAESNNKRSWTFLSGEFGFGKTSLALHLAKALQANGIICLYLPVAQFRERAFEMEGLFLWEVLRIILQEDVENPSDRHRILHAALKEIFKREKKIILIFDGIDEHPICWRENGLLPVFGIFKTFNISCLFAVREEFLAERSGHFQTAVKGGPGAFMLQLTEWPEALMVEYIGHYVRGAESDDVRQRIGRFEEAIRTGHYVDYYGDIPKRPLFLKMLLDDVAKDDLNKRNLAELYEIYIAKKFESDRATSTSSPVVRRPLNLDEDYEFVRARLFDVMTMAAGLMYAVEDGELRIQPSLLETVLRDCATKISTTSPLDIPSILLNSVMVPIGYRNRNQLGGYIEVAFAHTSFQEFFLARHMVAALLENAVDTKIENCAIPKPVMRFLDGLLSALPPDERNKARSALDRLSLVSI
jgi:hypothetical protein